MTYSDSDLAQDIERVRKIPLINTLLDVVCQTTGMGFAAVARVTQDRWIACSVRDDIQFGLLPGGELALETTICSQIRDSHQAVIIDDVRQSETFCNHPTPLLYGLQSYISFPIVLKTGEFFGTLCAIDPNPAQLDNPKITGLFRLLADLISFHLQQIQLVEQSQQVSDQLEQQVQMRTNQLQESVHDLQRSNANLQQFAYIASHDLQEPLRKIQQFGDILKTQYSQALGEEGVGYLARMQIAASRMSTLIKDLLVYSRIATQQNTTASVSLQTVVESVLTDLELRIEESGAVVEVETLPTVVGDATQLSQLFMNLLANAFKFRRAGGGCVVGVRAHRVGATDLPASVKPTRRAPSYHRIDVTDNGIGFDEQYLDRIFQVFQRLHGRHEFGGTGIGLAICEKVAANHGGGITATSQPGQGATFSLYLPV